MGKRNILVHLDLNRNELQNAVLQNLAADPATGVEGQKYYNTATHKERIYSEGEWKNVVDAYSLPVATSSRLGGIKVGNHLYMSGSASDSLTVDEATNAQKGVVRLATDSEASTGTATDIVITPAQLKAAIEGLPTPMQFKGTVGTGGTIEWSALPAASAANNGYEYIAISDHTAAPVCKTGDTIISNGVTWVVVPSGDEPAGTVTSVGLTAPTGLTVSGSPVTTSGSISLSLTNGYEIPTKAHVKNFGSVKDSSGTAVTASAYNDIIQFKVSGAVTTVAAVSASVKTLTIGSTDEKVSQSLSSANSELPVLIKNSANNTTEVTGTHFCSNVTINPSTGKVTAASFSGDGSSLTNVPPAAHTHGNINNTGSLTDTAAAPTGNDYVVIRDESTNKVQTSNIKATGVVDAVSKKHSHSSLTLSTTAQTYDGSHTLALPSTDPYTSSRTPAAHVHGNITNGGLVTGSAVAIANGDAILVSDASNSNRLVRSTTTFDGSSEYKILSQKGTWVDYSKTAILNKVEDTNKIVAFKSVFLNPALTMSGGQCTWAITHSLSSSDLVCSVREVSTGTEVYCDITHTSDSVVTIKINSESNIASGSYKAVLIG